MTQADPEGQNGYCGTDNDPKAESHSLDIFRFHFLAIWRAGKREIGARPWTRINEVVKGGLQS